MAEKCCPISVKRKLKIEANMLLCKTLMKFYVIIFALYFGGGGVLPLVTALDEETVSV